METQAGQGKQAVHGPFSAVVSRIICQLLDSKANTLVYILPKSRKKWSLTYQQHFGACISAFSLHLGVQIELENSKIPGCMTLKHHRKCFWRWQSASFINPKFLYFLFILPVFHPSRYSTTFASPQCSLFSSSYLEFQGLNLPCSVADVATVNYGSSLNSSLKGYSHPSRFICIFPPISDNNDRS